MPCIRWFAASLLALSLLAVSFLALAGAPGVSGAVVTVPSGFVDQVITTGLNRPIDMAFLPDGRCLVAEHKTGRVRLVVGGSIAAPDPLTSLPFLETQNYRGLMAIAVDPAWPARPFVYLYHSRYIAGVAKGRLVRYAASGQLSDPGGQSLTLSAPLMLMDDIPDDFEHLGGGLRFATSGHLFFSIGQAATLCNVQDSSRLEGKVLRLDVSSLPPGGGGPVARALITPLDNPIASPDSNARLVWARGFHNCWRLDVDPVSAKLFVVDPGETRPEEINLVEPGDNLGWPWRAGMNDVHVQADCPEPGGSGSNGFFKLPIHTFYPLMPSSVAVSDVEPYRGATGAGCHWPPEYEGDLFYSDFYQPYLRRLNENAGAWQIQTAAGQPNATDWATGVRFVTSMEEAADGSLWWLAMFDSTGTGVTGRIHRIATCPVLGVASGVPARAALAAAPNPFASLTETSFRLALPARARLAVYDLAGRRVRVLFDGEAPAGETRRRWDGRDDRGRPAAAGVYLVRLERESGTETVRVLRLR